MYCSVADVYRKAGITSSEVSEDDVKQHILEAELKVDRVTYTTFWSIETSGTLTGGSTNTVTDSAAEFGSNNELKGSYVWIYSGTGINQLQKISSHTNTVITIDSTFTTTPVSGDGYRIVHCGQDPRKTEYRDGDNTSSLFTYKYPIRRLNSVTIDSTSVTTSYVTVYDEEGELYLGSSAEATRWTAKKARLNVIGYWFGVYEIPIEARNLTALYAAYAILNQQMGGTHNIPSTYSLPEGSFSIGQAYVNIRGTVDVLQKQITDLERRIRKYPAVA